MVSIAAVGGHGSPRVRFVSISRDITERMRVEQALRESEGRFRMVADNMAQLAWTCDSLGNVTWYNQRWLDYTGLSFEEMKGWDWSKVQHPEHLEPVVKRAQRSAETGEPWDNTFPLRARDGSYRWVGTNTDVTDQMEAESQRQRLLDSEQQARREADAAVQISRTVGGFAAFKNHCSPTNLHWPSHAER